ncbi:hypothetical protein [Marinomonas sp. PE14-40]|uniref:hypothetical protein n=1 Tax=Marinomonas sp. PE14-40 TaxID=3060621 RepID=UPI003F67E019
MEEASINYIAWWGAGLSTLLAIIKLWELWQSRFRIDIGYGLTSDEYRGNNIYIRNLSGKPMILSYWELFYRHNFWPFLKDSYILSPEEDAFDSKIESYSSKTLNFRGPDHFSWGRESLKRRKIYIRLYVAGRKPIVKKIYK